MTLNRKNIGHLVITKSMSSIDTLNTFEVVCLQNRRNYSCNYSSVGSKNCHTSWKSVNSEIASTLFDG